MSIEEENKAVVRRFCELENQGDMDAIFEILAPGYVSHYSTGDSTREQNKQLWPGVWAAFHDLHFTMEHMLAEGDLVACQEIVTGTHKGEFMGIVPTGKKVTTTNTGIYRITSDKLAECWCTLDTYNLMQWLGTIPSQ